MGAAGQARLVSLSTQGVVASELLKVGGAGFEGEAVAYGVVAVEVGAEVGGGGNVGR